MSTAKKPEVQRPLGRDNLAMSEAQARVCAAVLLLECPGAHPEGTEYTSTQLGEYFKIEPGGIRAAKQIWKDDGMQRKTTIDLFKTGFYAWPTTPAAAPAALELAQVVPNPCLLYTSPSPRDKRQSRMPSSA